MEIAVEVKHAAVRGRTYIHIEIGLHPLKDETSGDSKTLCGLGCGRHGGRRNRCDGGGNFLLGVA